MRTTIDLKQWIRDVPDYPQPGIVFRDLTPLLAHPPALQYAIDEMASHVSTRGADAIGAIDARGFLFAAPIAVKLGLPLIPLRKSGKLPPETVGADYKLEYGTARLEARSNAVEQGQNVAIIDDLLATGGTAAAAGSLVEWLGGNVVSYAFLVELTDLNGRQALGDSDIFRLIEY